MFQQQDLLSAVNCYQNHEYLTALKIFNKALAYQHDEISQLTLETLAAVTNIQLCNYNEAAQQLNQLRVRISSLERYHNKQIKSEVVILKVKVLVNLLVIMLINCNQNMNEIFREIIDIVEEKIQKNKNAGIALFRFIISSLFGFQSFVKLQEQLEILLEKVQKSQQNRGKINRNFPLSPILLSTFSVFSHLSGKIEDAIRLEQKAYDLSRDNNPIAAVMSLRHLQQLFRAINKTKQSQSCRQELIILMSNEELDGIAEETLFRNYKRKIEYASTIIHQLIDRQRLWTFEEGFSLQKLAVVWKLKKMRNEQNQQRINTVLQMLSKDDQTLKMMSETEFIKDASKQYKLAIEGFIQITKKTQKVLNFKLFTNKLSQIYLVSNKIEPVSRVIDININQMESQSKPNNGKQTPKGKKHPYATTLYMPKKTVVNKFKEEQGDSPQNNTSELNLSNLSIKQANNKNQIYRKQEKQPSYKISKNNQDKKSHKVERGREDTNTNAKSKRKTEVPANQSYRSKDNKIIRQQNSISQFLRVQPSFVSRTQQERYKQSLPLKEKSSPKKEKQIDDPFLGAAKQKVPEQVPQPTVEIKPQITQSISNPLIFDAPTNTNHNSAIIPTTPNINTTFFSQLPNNILISQKQPLKDSRYQQKLMIKLRKYINLCQQGQYIEKRHFSSDGGAERFLKLGHQKDKLCWGDTQQTADSSYQMQDIRGIVYGKVTQTMVKEANKGKQPWKCFSIIMKKRTFDVYCVEQNDLKFWLTGLSLCLKDIDYDHPKYDKVAKFDLNKVQKPNNRCIIMGEKVMTRYYSVGRMLWRRCFQRLQWEYLKTKKKQKRNKYFCANAHAIILGAIKLMNYKLQIMKTI